MDADDFPAPGDFPGTERALIERYTYMPCNGCTDDHVTCYATGEAILRDAAFRDDDGEYFATEELAREADADASLDASHIRSESLTPIFV